MLSTILAAGLSPRETTLIFLLVALCFFGGAAYLLFARSEHVGAIIAALVGFVILIVAVF